MRLPAEEYFNMLNLYEADMYDPDNNLKDFEDGYEIFEEVLYTRNWRKELGIE